MSEKRICPECGHEEWSIDLAKVENERIPYTCQKCNHKLMVPVDSVFFYPKSQEESFACYET